jgi:hypothetical protein
MPKWSQPYRVRKRIQNAYLLERLDGMPIEGEFSTRRLHVFVLRRGGQLEKDQGEWEKQHKDDQDKEELEEELRGDTVQTLLFTEGEHRMGDGESEGKKDLSHQTPIR